MKEPKEYAEEQGFIQGMSIYSDTNKIEASLYKAIEMAQIDAYNEGLEDAANKARDIQRKDSRTYVSKKSILELKK